MLQLMSYIIVIIIRGMNDSFIPLKLSAWAFCLGFADLINLLINFEQRLKQCVVSVCLGHIPLLLLLLFVREGRML